MRLLLLATIAATVLEIGRGAHAQVGSPQPKRVVAAPTGPVIDPGWQTSVFGWLASRKSYPQEARQRGEEGQVAVRFTVDRSGRVVDAVIVSASGSKLLDDATLGLLRQAVLPPFPADMTQTRVTITTTMRYSLLPDPTVQWTDATREHCDARHTPLECSQYYNDANACLSEAEYAPTILITEREFVTRGETPKAAARFAAENIGHADIAALASRVPATMTPQEFGNRVMKSCLESITR